MTVHRKNVIIKEDNWNKHILLKRIGENKMEKKSNIIIIGLIIVIVILGGIIAVKMISPKKENANTSTKWC